MLCSLPDVPKVPIPFKPVGKLMKERVEALSLNPDEFLWPDEEKLVMNLLMLQEGMFAWTELERGTFDLWYFNPVHIPMIPHVPWVRRNIPIPPGILRQTIELL